MKTELAWVDALLNRWGRWALRCQSGALGFASSSILTCAPDGDVFDTAIPRGVMDDDMEAVDGAVRRLPKGLRLVVVEVYQFSQGRSDRKIADSLGYSRQAMQEYVVRAHRQIAIDISVKAYHNHAHSAKRGSCLESNQPVTVRA